MGLGSSGKIFLRWVEKDSLARFFNKIHVRGEIAKNFKPIDIFLQPDVHLQTNTSLLMSRRFEIIHHERQVRTIFK